MGAIGDTLGDSIGGAFRSWEDAYKDGSTGLEGVQTIDPDKAEKNPQKAQARLIEEQQDLFDSRFKSLEDNAIRRTMNRELPEEAANDAASRVRRVFSGASDRADRQLSRYGREPSAGLQSAMERKSGLSEARSAAGAANNARTTVSDQQTGWATDLLNVGQGLSQSSTSALGSASSMASQRKQIGEQRAAQNKQSTISTIGTAAGIAASMGFL